jgi:hypothetical protein
MPIFGHLSVAGNRTIAAGRFPESAGSALGGRRERARRSGAALDCRDVLDRDTAPYRALIDHEYSGYDS